MIEIIQQLKKNSRDHLLNNKVEMVAQLVAQLPEFGLSLVLEAKLEGLLGNVVIKALYARVGAQQFQALAVGLP
jgi:hypothetical protein